MTFPNVYGTNNARGLGRLSFRRSGSTYETTAANAYAQICKTFITQVLSIPISTASTAQPSANWSNLRRLFLLRNIAILGQLGAVWIAHVYLHMDLPLVPLMAIITGLSLFSMPKVKTPAFRRADFITEYGGWLSRLSLRV